MKRLLAIGIVVMALSSCSSQPSRVDVVSAVASNVAIPMFTNARNAAADLLTATQATCAGSTDTNVVDAFDRTRAAWRTSEVLWSGPVMSLRAQPQIDAPITPADIDRVLTDATLQPVTTETVSTRLGADERGLGALQHLLHIDKSETPVLATATPNECVYATAVAQVIADHTTQVATAWTNGNETNGAYGQVIAADADAADMALDDVVNQAVGVLRSMGNADFGADTNDTVAPQIARLDGVQTVMIGGAETEGLRPLLGAELAQRITDQTADARRSLEAINGVVATAVATGDPAVADAQVKIEVLRRTLTTEVVSRLGVTVSFSDSDGDSSG